MKATPRSRSAQIAGALMVGMLLVLATSLLVIPARLQDFTAAHLLTPSHALTMSSAQPQQDDVSEVRARKTQIMASYARVPLSFEANAGQANQRVKFISRGSRYTLLLTATEAMLSLRNPDASGQSAPRFQGAGHLVSAIDGKQATARHVKADDTFLTMRIVGASPTAEMSGIDPLPGNSNYFIGNDPKFWRTGVPSYSRVQCKGIYPGVDLLYYGNHGRIEYDFVVSPGGDPSQISWTINRDGQEQSSATRPPKNTFSHAWSSRIDSQGDLVLSREGREVRFHRPQVYQTAADSATRTPVDGHYLLKADNEIGFTVAAYDHDRPLVIDPALSYSTYLGGSGDEGGLGIAIDAAGNAYVAGYTTSTNFPTMNPVQAAYAGGPDDVFVTKFDPTGTKLVYSTYLGGSGDDVGEAIAVDSSGNAYVTGYTTSTDFPTVGAFQALNGGNSDAFVTKLNGIGGIVYSTYLGGKGNDIGYGIAVDASGNAYVAGQVGSGNFPVKGAFQSRKAAYQDAFVTKLNAAGNALVYSTYLGGSSYDRAYAIAVDSAGEAYVTGSTTSSNFPTLTPYQSGLAGHSDVFVTKLNATGKTLAYSTYLGGSNVDSPSSIVVDSLGNAYVAGGTASSNFPTVNPFQASKLDTDTAFVTELNPTGTGLVFSTYFGGSLDEFAGGIGVDPSGNIYVSGYTRSTDLPTKNPIQAHLRGAWNIFVTEFAPGGQSLVYSTYLGGRYINWSYHLAVDSAGDVYTTGGTQALDFPVKNAFQSTNAGSYDAFVVKITP